MKIDAKYLQLKFYNNNIDKFRIIAPNIFLDSGMYTEMDLCCIRKNGYLEEIEVKLTKSDFKLDFKKKAFLGSVVRNKHSSLEAGLLPVNRFSFLMTEELAKTVQIPSYAGLYVLTTGHFIRKVKTPKLLHKNKIDKDFIIKTACKMSYRYWALLNKEEFEK